MLEFFKHVLGICGDHWHPNIWTAVASTPIVAPIVYYIKCKCGGNCPYGKQCPAWPMYFGIPSKIPPAHPVRWHIGR